MKIKLFVLIPVLLISLSAFTQTIKDSTVISGTSPQLSDTAIKNLAPIEGKAIVYIVRPDIIGFIVPMKVECDSLQVGTTTGKKYLYTILNPGHHIFISRTENHFKLELTLEANKIYYIRQDVSMGWVIAETGLKLIGEKEGRKDLNKCKLAKENTYPEIIPVTP